MSFCSNISMKLLRVLARSLDDHLQVSRGTVQKERRDAKGSGKGRAATRQNGFKVAWRKRGWVGSRTEVSGPSDRLLIYWQS
jgi:hypothetical protein